MPRFSVRVDGKPTEEVLRRVNATPGLEVIGTSGYWVGEKEPEEDPPIQALTIVVTNAETAEEARKQVEAAVPDKAYRVNDPDELPEHPKSSD